MVRFKSAPPRGVASGWTGWTMLGGGGGGVPSVPNQNNPIFKIKNSHWFGDPSLFHVRGPPRVLVRLSGPYSHQNPRGSTFFYKHICDYFCNNKNYNSIFLNLRISRGNSPPLCSPPEGNGPVCGCITLIKVLGEGALRFINEDV